MLAGWVQARRNMGKIVFIDLRDSSGVVQIVFGSALKRGSELLKTLRPEYVVRVIGLVTKRQSGQENPDLATGTVEVQAQILEILNQAETPPFEIGHDRPVGEDIRLRFRYLDLRNRRMLNNLTLRHKVWQFIRNYLTDRRFLEVETPFLTKGTPEGAREYIVPARHYPGKFYILPQSPQQFKQLLMVAGIERYFQIVRCFRDEDTRGDRQPEFTQLDLEMSFIEQADVLNLLESLLVALIKAVTPEKTISHLPFPRITYAEAIKKYQTDKPDLRRDKTNSNELAFAFIVDWPLFEFSATEGKLVPMHHLFTSPRDEDVKLLTRSPDKARSKQHDLVLNGFEIGGGSIRIHQADVQRQVFEALKLSATEVEKRFGHMLEAFRYGAPPHGGIALGLDRLLAILANEPNIREVIAFPKTGDGRDLMMGAPSELPDQQLREAHITIRKAPS